MVEFRGSRRRRYVLLLMVLFSFTLATLDNRSHDAGVLGVFGRFAHRIVQPVSSAAATVFSPFHDWWRGLSNHGDIVTENRKLKNELQKLQEQLRTVKDNATEIKRLQEFFNSRYERSYKTVGAHVLSSGPGFSDDTVFINRGRNAGVQPDMAVLGPGGLIGTVAQSWTGGATIALVSDPQFGIGAKLTTSAHSDIARTRADGRLVLTLSDDPRDATSKLGAKVGDTVVTCGCQSSIYPPDIPIGTIVSATRSADRSTMTIVMQSLLDRSSLQNVLVVIWHPGNPIPKGLVATTTTRSAPATVLPTTSSNATSSVTSTSTSSRP